MKLLVATVLTLFALPSHAMQNDRSYQPGWSHQEKCYKRVYREEYIPGTMNNPGYVKKYFEKVEVPCKENYHSNAPATPRNSKSNVDDNSCIEGSIIGGIAGGALGGVLATEKNWIWSIPAGVIGGAMAGCQVDGG